MWGIIIALVSGALMSIQGVFNTEVTKQTSIWVSSGWVQLTAFLTCLLMWICTGREQINGLGQVHPWYMLTGGVIGALITYTVIKSVGSLGPAKSALLIVIWNRSFGAVWSRKDRIGVEKIDWCCSSDCRYYYFPILIQNVLVFAR